MYYRHTRLQVLLLHANDLCFGAVIECANYFENAGYAST
jgi:hypothetical protein